MNIIWDNSVAGLCYDGCSAIYCNPLNVGYAIGIAFGVVVVVLYFFSGWEE